jgi:hypothetical protein
LEPFNVGDVILDKYEVTKVLGQGGMGRVLAARHRELDELVALKFLLPSLRERSDLAARFAREARTANRIKNHHVVRVLDVDSVDGVPFMERTLRAASTGKCAPGSPAPCEAACAANEPQSCYELAKMVAKGDGVPKDPARAATLYQTACDGGVLAACSNLGAVYAVGDGVAQDATKAVALYKRACDGGYATACLNLGAMHFEGNGVPKNESLGARLFFRACDAGEPLGCLNVSIAYGEGRGVPKDAARSSRRS